MDDTSQHAYEVLSKQLDSAASASQITSALLECVLPTIADGVPFEKQGSDAQRLFRRVAVTVLGKAMLDHNRRLLETGDSCLPRRPTGDTVQNTIALVVFQLWNMRILPPVSATPILGLMSIVPQKALSDMLISVSSQRELTEAVRGKAREQQAALEIASTFSSMTKRLQKGDHAELVGQTYGWLASALPNEFRPACNLAGAVNSGHSIKIENVPEGTTDSLGEPVKQDVYTSFWQLQSSFQRLKQVLQQPAQWTPFKDAVNVVLNQFAQCPVRVSSKVAVHSVGDDTSAQYLSSPSLLALQVQDATFRRQILVQILIALNQINNPGKGDNEVNPKIRSAVATMEPQVIAALRATPDDGPEFTDAILRQLSGEKVWVEWKKTTPQCKPLAVPVPAAVSARLDKAKAAKAALTASLQHSAAPAASDNLRWDQLWNTAPEDTMAGLDMESRGLFKNLNDMMTTVLDEMDTDNPFYDPQAPKSKDDGIFNWRVLRMLVRRDVRKFARMVNKQKGDLEWMASEMFPDHPASKKWKLEEKDREKKRIEEERKRGEQERARRAEEPRGKGSKRPASSSTTVVTDDNTSMLSVNTAKPRESAPDAADPPEAPAAKRARQERAPADEKPVQGSPKATKAAVAQPASELASQPAAADAPAADKRDRQSDPPKASSKDAPPAALAKERERGKDAGGKDSPAAKDGAAVADTSAAKDSAKDRASQLRAVKREPDGSATGPADDSALEEARLAAVKTEHAAGNSSKPLESAKSDASRESQEGTLKRKTSGMPPPASRQPSEPSKASDSGHKAKDAGDDPAPKHRKIMFPDKKDEGKDSKADSKVERTQAPRTSNAGGVRGRGSARGNE